VIREIDPDDWGDWRILRQRSLTEDPQAFASSVSMWTGDNDTEARWRARLESDGACFIAYADGLPVGMIAGRAIDDHVELISMWVAPEARRKGLAHDLIRAVKAWAGDRSLSLRVVDGNAAATTLYESQGFVMDPACADAEGCRTMLLSQPKESG